MKEQIFNLKHVILISFVIFPLLYGNLVQAEEYNMFLNKGWHLIALPIVPEDPQVSMVFPNARFIYGYEKGYGYVRIKDHEDLEVGKGYWILIEEDEDYLISGSFAQDYSVKLNGGIYPWTLIGIAKPMDNYEIIMNGCSIDKIYCYDAENKQYFRLRGLGSSTTLDLLYALNDGEACWIRVLPDEASDECIMEVSSAPPPLSF